MAANSKSSKARALLAQGISNKEVARRTGLSITTIYTIKWKQAKKQGLGAIKPTTPAVGKGTGIASVPRAAVPLEFEIIDRPKAKKQSNNRRNAQLKRWAREREERAKRQMQVQLTDAANMYPKPGQFIGFYGRTPKPSLWQRIKGFFVGA